MPEDPKKIIFTGVADVLRWHKWMIVSLMGTAPLLFLNFMQVGIGGELGRSPSASANVLGILQIVVKVHELFIVASLVAVAVQWILWDLLGDGLPLGLLGAEGSIASPSFLLSQQFRLALKFGFHKIYLPSSWKGNPDRLRILRLVLFLFSCCIIAGLAGPASAVLMIPRIDWFLHSINHIPPVMRATLPTVMIGTSPGILLEEGFMESNVFAFPDIFVGTGFRYWKDVSGFELRDPGISLPAKSIHHFHDYYGHVYVNTTGTLQRPLDGIWTGGTRITTTARNNADFFSDWTDVTLIDVQQMWADVKYVESTHGYDASVTCRAATKLRCSEHTADVDSPRNTAVDNDPRYPDWCYRSIHQNSSFEGEIRMGRNLLMAKDFVDDQPDPRVWVTEGPRVAQNVHYSDSLEILFEKLPGALPWISNLTVCSFSAVLVTGVATSLGSNPQREQVDYLDHVIRLDDTIAPPRKFLFHENWLDRAFSYDPALWLAQSIDDNGYVNGISYNNGTPYPPPVFFLPTGSMRYPDNFTYAARPGLTPRLNTFGSLGENLIYALGYGSSPESAEARIEAFPVGAAVGGILTYLLSWSLPSDNQYTMSYDEIPPQFRLGPPESFSRFFSSWVYRKGYGFRLSSRTAYLGVAVLVWHAIIVVVGSMWQLKRRRIIRAWSTVPDYLCLGSGSASLVLTHPNTCAGVAGKEALSGLVKIGVTDNGDTPHLQIGTVGGAGLIGTEAVEMGNAEKLYGFSVSKEKED